MTPFRVAITGCHRMLEKVPAGHNWAAAFAGVPETRIVAVHDFGAETRERFAAVWDVPAYDDYTAMLERERPEIVCVATRQTMHADQIEAAVDAGARGILCEKPLATSMAEADRIAAACARGGVRFTLCLDRRWMAWHRHVRALVDGGLIGAPRAIASFGVTNLIAHGCHWFDMLANLAGDPGVAWVAGNIDEEHGNADDRPGAGVIGFANGVRAFVDAAGAGVSFDVIGAAGRLTVLGDNGEGYLWTRDGASPLQPRVFPAPPPANDPREEAVRDLVAAIREGRPTACDIPTALRSLEIGLAFHASHARGGARVECPLADRDLRVPSLPWGNE